MTKQEIARDLADLLDLRHRLEQMTRERDKLAALAELSDGYRRERDEARAQLAALDADSPCDGHRHCCADRRKLAEELLRVRAERDALKEKP